MESAEDCVSGAFDGMQGLKWPLLALVAAWGGSAAAREMRRPLPPRRPPVVARTNAVKKVQSVRLGEKSGPSRVDVLVAYDRPAAMWANWKGGGVTNFAAVAVGRMNAAVTNSNLQGALLFRLVGIQEVSASGGNDFDGILTAVTDGVGSWAPVSQARDRLGADIAMTLIDTGSAYGTTGLSWAMYDTDYEQFADYAFGVCSIRAVAEGHTMTHEVGHLFGAGHSERQHPSLDPGPLLFPYSSGYYFETNGVPCHTIMAYDDDGYGNWYEEVSYFSSPEIRLGGVAIGTAAYNDNARTLRETAPAVAAFREVPLGADYSIVFQDVVDPVPSLHCQRGVVYALPQPSVRSTWRGVFAGWRCLATGKRYDAGVLVYDLGTSGATVAMTAIWE